MESLKTIIGRNIREVREQVGLTRAELCERLNQPKDTNGLSETALGLIERGVSWPKYENIKALAKALNCDERVFVSLSSPALREPTPLEALEIIRQALTAIPKYSIEESQAAAMEVMKRNIAKDDDSETG